MQQEKHFDLMDNGGDQDDFFLGKIGRRKKACGQQIQIYRVGTDDLHAFNMPTVKDRPVSYRN